MGLKAQTFEFNKNGGGLDIRSSPNLVDEDRASDALNIDYLIDGSFLTRNGSSITNVDSSFLPSQISGAPKSLLFFDYKNSNSVVTNIICAGTKIYHDLVTPTAQVTGLSASMPYPDIEYVATAYKEYAVWGNGEDTNLKYDGTSWTNLSLPRPDAPTTSFSSTSGTLAAGDYEYYQSFAIRDLATNIIVQEGELSKVGALTIPSTGTISVGLAISTDSQVNTRVIYRVSPSSNGVAYRLYIVEDNTTVSFSDGGYEDGTIEADYDQQATAKFSIGELDDYGRFWTADTINKNVANVSKPYEPWATPTENQVVFDAEITCIKRCFGCLIVGTTKSIWVQNGKYGEAEPRRVSSLIGILNNRCAVGEDILYFLGTNRKFYTISPTDFSQNEMRISDPLSEPIDPIMSQISAAQTDYVCMEYYTKSDLSKVMISAPVASNTNNKILIFNEERSRAEGKPVWHIWDNISASAMKSFNLYGEISLRSGDYNGFLWKLDDPAKGGDGAQENGTATSATSTTLVDSSKAWTANAFVGVTIRVISGTGAGQSRVITANGTTSVTVSTWTTTPDATSVYTIGGFDHYYFCNWKSLTGSYDELKQLWYLFVKFKALGNYSITIYFQYDYNTSLSAADSTTISFDSGQTDWNESNWNAFYWATINYRNSQIRKYARFRALRIGFYHQKAAQPFLINGFSLSAQNKGLFFGGAA